MRPDGFNMYYKRPLEIKLIWDSAFEKGNDYAELIYQNFMRNEDIAIDYNLNIPVYFLTKPDPNLMKSSSISTIYFVFVDDNMIINRKLWEPIFIELEKYVKQESYHLVPIKFSSYAFITFESFKLLNFYIEDDKTKFDKFLLAAAYSIYRIVFNNSKTEKIDIPLFLSHAKRTKGEDIAKNIIKYISNSKSPVKVFFDENDIHYGERFDIIIEDNLKKSALVVLHTDGYSSREFCRRELMLAKKYERPIVLVDYLEKGENRSFPYMGNTKTIRVEKNINYFKLIFEILKESIRLEYFKQKNQSIVEFFHSDFSKTRVIPYPPELLTMAFGDNTKEVIIYPNPILGNEEVHILKTQNPNKSFLTPILYVTSTKNYREMLNGHAISFSISESSDMSDSKDKLYRSQEMLVNISRYLIASGSKLVYTGSIIYPKFNFLDILIEQLKTYKEWIEEKEGISKDSLEYLYLKKSSNNISKSQLASVASVANLKSIDPIVTSDIDEINESLSLTKIREQASQIVTASIFIGGKDQGYLGVMPGVLEEFLIAIKNKKSIFLLGAFGGIVSEIIKLIDQQPEQTIISNDYQVKQKQEFFNEYNKYAVNNDLKSMDFSKIAQLIRKIKISDLNNGLTNQENFELFRSDDPDLVSSLILKGLSKIVVQI